MVPQAHAKHWTSLAGDALAYVADAKGPSKTSKKSAAKKTTAPKRKAAPAPKPTKARARA